MTTAQWYYITKDQRSGEMHARTVTMAMVVREAGRWATGSNPWRAMVASGQISGVNRAYGEDYRYVREDLLTDDDRALIAIHCQ